MHGCGHTLLTGLASSWKLSAELIWQLCEQSKTIASFYSSFKLDPYTRLGDINGKPQHLIKYYKEGNSEAVLKDSAVSFISLLILI